MKQQIIIAALIISLALFGGQQFFYQPIGPLVIGIVGGLGLVAYLRGARPAILRPLLVLIGAALLSTMANWDIITVSSGRLLLGLAAVGWLGIIYHARVFDGFYLAGIIWPAVYWLAWLLGWFDNPNITAAWSVIFLAVGLSGKKWLYILPHVILLIWLGSRGAALGVMAVIIVYLWPILKAKSLIPIAPALALLCILRPVTTMIRFGYWQKALNSFINSPVLGIGPGGLWARHIILEPGSDLYQIHAHNIIITWLAENGLVGIILAAIAIIMAYRRRLNLEKWQAAIMAGLLAHSMVDSPLWWPGLMIVGVIIIGVEHWQNPNKPVMC